MIIWLASYPKSGNTWLRSIICSLIYSNDGNFNSNLFENIKQFPVARQFSSFTNDVSNFNEIKKYWLAAQKKINEDGKTKFFKTHHINCDVNGYSFTNYKNTLATIYVIRDPRNLINSISHHYSMSINEAKNFILKPQMIIGHNKYAAKSKKVLPVLLGRWKEHYKFWKKNNTKFYLIKYEDLIKNPERELHKLIIFLKKFMSVDTNSIKTKNILESTKFENLKALEKKGEFIEQAYDSFGKKKDFFNLGPNNNYKEMLDKETIKEIEDNLSTEMLELGYLK